MKNVEKTANMTDYITYLKKNSSKPILIYGAGIVAYYFACELLENENFRKAFSGFVVQNPAYDVKDYWGIPVSGIDEYENLNDKYCLIIATKKNVWNEIDSYLEKHGWRNYYFLSGEEFEKIRIKNSRLIESEYIIGQFERIRTTFKRLECDIGNVKRLLSDSAEKYDYHGRRNDEKNYLNDFKQFCSRKEYMQEVRTLLSGLESESRETVCQILDRLNRLCDNVPISFSTEEKKQLEKIENEFYGKKFKISDSLYMYKDYKLPIDHFETPVFWYEHGIKMLGNFDSIKSKCLIDAGGFIGDSALVFSKYWEGKIYSFEADPDNYRCMEEVIRLNDLNGVIPVNAALTDREGIVNFYKAMAISCNTMVKDSRFSQTQEESIHVQGRTIDGFVEEYGLSVGLIKTDVEGAEQSLLRGAEKTIKNQKPDLIISIYHSIDDFFHIKKQIEALNAGYRFKIFLPVLKESFLLETCLICEIDRDKE